MTALSENLPLAKWRLTAISHQWTVSTFIIYSALLGFFTHFHKQKQHKRGRGHWKRLLSFKWVSQVYLHYFNS